MTLTSALESLRQKARLAPEGPGIYIHRDRNREVLYVGKARNLRNRLRSYFFGTERLSQRIRQLVSRIEDFDIVLSQNENESLVLEAQFIKSHQPPFNILLRDGKAYPYVRVDTRESWPTLRMVRRRREDGALYFGPYASGTRVMDVLAVIRKFFPLVKCTPRVMKTIPRPCNYFHMNQCLAPCHVAVDPKHYKAHVDAAIALLRGQIRSVRTLLNEQMLDASAREDFERAAVYRDQIKAIEDLGQSQSVDFGLAFDLDLVTVFWGADRFSVAILGVRNGQVVQSHTYSSPYALDVMAAEGGTESSVDDGVLQSGGAAEIDLRCQTRLASLLALLRVFYLSHTPASTICVCDRAGHWSATVSAGFQALLPLLRKQGGGPEITVTKVTEGAENLSQSVASGAAKREQKALQQELERLLLSLYDTARQKYQQDKLLGSQQEQMVLGLQTFLDLPAEPSWIECFDISTFQGAETVASQVVFRDGTPFRKGYRRYVIKTIETQDDFGSLREVMRRRFRDVVSFGTPDLVVVDGGEPQLREVKKVLVGMGLADLPVVGIAKSRTRSSFVSNVVEQSLERMVLVSGSDGQGFPVSFETRALRIGSPEYRLVTQMRDEAHRFAITFHRQRRNRRSMGSLVDGIAGLGPRRKKILLEAFPDPLALLDLAAADICARTGFSPLLVDKVLTGVRAAAGNASKKD